MNILFVFVDFVQFDNVRMVQSKQNLQLLLKLLEFPLHIFLRNAFDGIFSITKPIFSHSFSYYAEMASS